MKTDTAGNLLWEKKFGTTLGELSWDIVSNDLGNLYALGEINSALNGSFPTANYGSYDFVIMSFDTSGTLLTYKILGANSSDVPNKILFIISIIGINLHFYATSF
mgnify:CR=1 FL=1